MHVVFRESHSLDEVETPVDLQQTAADLIVLSYSDSDLGAFAAGWRGDCGNLPSLRLANLKFLRHPLSVDTYINQTLAHARGVLIRLIGGEAYWSYGLSAVSDLARRKKIALAVVPADGRQDDNLDNYSTVPISTLRQLNDLCDIGGAAAAHAALAQLALAAGLSAPPAERAQPIPATGFYDPDKGVLHSISRTGNDRDCPVALVVFYRSYLTSADTHPIDALICDLRKKGFAAFGVFVSSLKNAEAAAWIRREFLALQPWIIVNATAFSAVDNGGATPFDDFAVPVIQVALSTARRADWLDSMRGLSPADLAMHVALPEVDGRIFGGVVSFKSAAPVDRDLQFSHATHETDIERAAAAVDRICAWHRLSQLPNDQKLLAIVASSYPGRPHQLAHAVGLDVIASCDSLARELAARGYKLGDDVDTLSALHSTELSWTAESYKAALKRIPATLQQDIEAAWGKPEDDPNCTDGLFQFRGNRFGNVVVAMQPERGSLASREADYHDLSRVPRHTYLAFYFWLRSLGTHAVIHMGAHGTLEWLPGKATGLSSSCWPEAIIGSTPVVYPFIVNDPGEAAQAKRRIGAVTVGHLPPPLRPSSVPERLTRLEHLLDEYSTADGLDPSRRQRLISDIRQAARDAGVEQDLGIPATASPAEAIPRIDRFVCDLKESQYGDGLHIFGTGTCGAMENAGLFAALAGRLVRPGPAGSPNRGRSDVLPTGRNLYSVDPRSVPTQAAFAQGVKLAEELLRRHLQDHGDWPKSLLVDLWGSATMRTAGEDFAMALHLAGIKPAWHIDSGRLAGFDIVPLAMLGRPRIDVTLRVSGLFRDIFSTLAQLFEQASSALAERDWEGADNPYSRRSPRVFGPRPGQFGVGVSAPAADFSDAARSDAGNAWLNASAWAIGTDGESRHDRGAIEERLASATAFVHVQDLPETDLLLAADFATHEAGPAAAAAHLGIAGPALYHLDATRPDQPRARTLTEEISRVVHARAANPGWIKGMMRHGFRGAAEIAATLEHLASFAHLSGSVPSHLFDLYHDATLTDEVVSKFLQDNNPEAYASMHTTFQQLLQTSLWVTRRNSILSAFKVAS